MPLSAGIIKKALACSTLRKSFSGILATSPLIFVRAEANVNGEPVKIAPPLSAAYSLYLEIVNISNWLMKWRGQTQGSPEDDLAIYERLTKILRYPVPVF